MNLIKILTKIKFIPLHFVFWVLVWLFYSYFFGFNTNNEKYVFWFSSILIPITIANTYFSIYYLIPNYLLTKRYGVFFLYGIYAFIGSAYFITIAMFFGFIYMSEFDFKEMPPLSRSLPFILISIYLVVIIVSAFKLVFYNYQSLEKHKDLENKFLYTKLKLKEEELKFLKAQIHPHFLFNTLNTMYGLALKKSDETPNMILKLSNLLDYILYQINKPFVSLSKEINHIEDYIVLEKMRFHETLNVTLTIQKLDLNYNIAPMLLLPFVENSFKHGNLINGVLSVSILIKTDDDNLIFSIKNSNTKTENTKKGIGLENIKKRLDLLYPKQHKLDISQTKNEFEILLKLNKNEQ